MSAGETIVTFRSNRMFRLACERLWEIIGESLNAASRSEPDLRDRFPEIGQVIGLRNRIIHGYDQIDDQVVWDSIQTDLPILITRLEEVLEPTQ